MVLAAEFMIKCSNAPNARFLAFCTWADATIEEVLKDGFPPSESRTKS